MRSARKLTRRAHRDESSRFLMEGLRSVAEALECEGAVRELFVTGEDPAIESLTRRAEDAGVAVTSVDRRVLEAISDTTTPQDVVAVVSFRSADLDAVAATSDVVVVLAGVRDPGNAGTLVRSSVAAEAGAVVFARGSVDPWHPKTARAAAGALLRVPIVRHVDLRHALEVLRAGGSKVVGADARAASACDRADLSCRIALVLGNESWGVPELGDGVFDELVSIPMPGAVESLNVGVAGSILLFEAIRQRRVRGDSSARPAGEPGLSSPS